MLIKISSKELQKILNFLNTNNQHLTYVYLDGMVLVCTDKKNTKSLNLDIEEVKVNNDKQKLLSFGVPTTTLKEILLSIKFNKERKKPIKIDIGDKKVTFSGKLFRFQLRIMDTDRKPKKQVMIEEEVGKSKKYWIIKNPEELTKTKSSLQHRRTTSQETS